MRETKKNGEKSMDFGRELIYFYLEFYPFINMFQLENFQKTKFKPESIVFSEWVIFSFLVKI